MKLIFNVSNVNFLSYVFPPMDWETEEKSGIDGNEQF